MVNDVLHGERIVDGTAARVRSAIHRPCMTVAPIVRISKIRDRFNFNKIRGEFAENFHKSCSTRRTAFSNVTCMVAVGE